LGGNLIITLNASTIIFEDNGGGIEESILERIFSALLYYQRARQGHRAWALYLKDDYRTAYGRNSSRPQ